MVAWVLVLVAGFVGLLAVVAAGILRLGLHGFDLSMVCTEFRGLGLQDLGCQACVC